MYASTKSKLTAACNYGFVFKNRELQIINSFIFAPKPWLEKYCLLNTHYKATLFILQTEFRSQF